MAEQRVIPGIDFDAIHSPDGLKYVQHPNWIAPPRPSRRKKVVKREEQGTLWEDMA